ncbi:hypothetical protein FRB94_000166 [Tulasnella sp. JGI-2019a]|nr:hypothetical protein FRB94_000166 [Tulasnella sp. JGI-2019a]
MFSDGSNSTDQQGTSDTTSRRPAAHKRTIHPIHRHKRLPSAFTADTLTTLPEYQAFEGSHSRPTPRTRLPVKTLIDGTPSWDGDEMPPPPGYPESLNSPAEGEMSPEDADEEKGVLRLPGNLSKAAGKPRRRRSYGGTDEDRLDSLLERSIIALQQSNALMQSSLATHSSLSNILADTTFDKSMDAQIQFLCRRYASEEQREANMDHVLTGVSGLISDHNDWGISNELALEQQDDHGITRSLPAENHMHMALLSRPSIPLSNPPQLPPSQNQRRLRLSADGRRPRSPPPRPFTQYVSIESPNGFAAEATATGDAIYLPSTSGIRSSPKTAKFSPPTSAPPTPSFVIGKQEQQTTPTKSAKSQLAHAMLTRIASGSTATSRTASPEAIRSLFVHLPRSPKHLFSSQEVLDETIEDRGRHQQTGARIVSDSQAIPSRSSHRARSASTSTIPSASSTKRSESEESLPTEINQVGKAPPSAFAITASLRKILEESDEKRATAAAVSEVAAGKQRAEGERPDSTSPSRWGKGVSHLHLRPAALGAVSSPSASDPIVYRGEKSASDRILEPPIPFQLDSPTPNQSSAGPSNGPDTPRSSTSGSLTPRRSAMKGASGHTTPISSGQNSPFRVSFSPLPPKHDTDGTFIRAKEKGKVKGKSKNKEEPEKRGWWTEWLLGTAPGDSKNHTFTPVHSRNGSMVREEGRWTGGAESWQV